MNRYILIVLTFVFLLLLGGCTYPPAREHSRLGDLYFYYGKYPQAEKEYREVIHLNPRDAKTHFKLGNMLVMRAWGIDDSIKWKEKISQGKVERNDSLMEEAVKEYREAVRLKPDLVEVYWHLGNIFQQQGKIEEAEKEAREYIRVRPWDYFGYYYYAGILDNQGRRKEARKYWEKGLRMLKRKADPKSDEVIKHRLAEPD